jgi:hypothetical protein
MPQMFKAPTGAFVKASPSEVEAAFAELNAPLPGSFMVYGIGDPLDVLPGGDAPASPRAKMTALRQRSADQRALYLPVSDDLREARLEKQRLAATRSQLTQHRMYGGRELGETDQSVVDVQEKLDKVSGEIERLGLLAQHREAALHATSMLTQRCESYLRTKRGQLIEAPVIQIDEILKKGEKPRDGLQRVQHRGRELAADAHGVRSRAWPISVEKKNAKAQIEQWAEAGEPYLDAMIEHNAPLAFPTISLSSLVRGEKPALAFTEMVDFLGVICWALGDQMLEKINASLDEKGDDKYALDQQQREQMEAQIMADALMTERQEACIVWHMQQAGDAVEHRADIDVRAVLGLLETRAA